MSGWVVAWDATAFPGIASIGPVGTAVFDTLVAGVGTDGVLQAGGTVSAMVVAGALVLGLGLSAVAVWQGYATVLVNRLRNRAETTDGQSAGPSENVAKPETADTQHTEKQVEESPEPTAKDRILDILDENDGRVKQASIVENTGWSKSKVSMVLSEMEEDGIITKLRVGRENIVSLEGEEPDAADSPFDSQ